ncbi:MAG: hypothetical protein V3V29_02025 [Acidimicrobiia bacterium]
MPSIIIPALLGIAFVGIVAVGEKLVMQRGHRRRRLDDIAALAEEAVEELVE